MKLKVQISNDSGKVIEYNLNPNSEGEGYNLDKFILDCLAISEDKRKLPLLIQCPNGSEVYPSLKMKFSNYGSPLLGDEIEAMVVTWRY